MKRPCNNFVPLLGVFADGELSADKAIDVEQHLAQCRSCAERVRFDASVRASVRRALANTAPVSNSFQERLRGALLAEREREQELERARAEESRESHKMLPWRVILPLAAAAGLPLAWAGSATPEATAAHEPSSSRANLAVASNVDQLIDEFVRYHAEPPAPAVTEPSLVPQMEPQVGLPVRLPSLQQYGARWEGGSVVPMPVPNQRAASFRYEVGGHPVTVYVYDSRRFPLRVTLEPRVVRDQPVYVGTRRGYTLAAVENRGVGYAIATDLNDRESAELVAAIH